LISNRHLLDISVWLDIKKTTIGCIKTQRYLLCNAKVLVCLVRYWMFNTKFTMFLMESLSKLKKIKRNTHEQIWETKHKLPSRPDKIIQKDIILSWLDISERAIWCIKTLRYILFILEVLVCLALLLSIWVNPNQETVGGWLSSWILVQCTTVKKEDLIKDTTGYSFHRPLPSLLYYNTELAKVG
jgi:hypothetical protein